MPITIRKAEPSDARAVQAIFESPKAYSNTLQLPFSSFELWHKRLSDQAEHVHAYVAVVDGQVVGNITLNVCTNQRRRHAASFGMGIKDQMQGVGVGSALLATVIDLADNWLNLKRIELTVFTDNQPAIGLYKKFGFEIEGESKAYAFRNGEYVDAYHMARVRA
ncbi:GNAT family N-acetyltransferase [Vibrio sp. CDRSL-10 TSBA]